MLESKSNEQLVNNHSENVDNNMAENKIVENWMGLGEPAKIRKRKTI